jgi:hypothetical protein
MVVARELPEMIDRQPPQRISETPGEKPADG